jgi:predicted aminopeptidase
MYECHKVHGIIHVDFPVFHNVRKRRRKYAVHFIHATRYRYHRLYILNVDRREFRLDFLVHFENLRINYTRLVQDRLQLYSQLFYRENQIDNDVFQKLKNQLLFF